VSAEAYRALLLGPAALAVGLGMALMVFAGFVRLSSWLVGTAEVRPLDLTEAATTAKAKYGR
jgi:hypothetical protein